MQEAFDKLRGVDIFSLKSYMEPTGFASFNGAWVLINELFVNFFFFILNAVVGFFSLLIRILEKIDLYSSYKNYVFNGAMSIWKGFIGSNGSGVAKNSLVSMLLLILAFYLFYQYFFSKGSFSRTLLHVFLVLILGFGYFGTVAGTSGGLYLLDTINNVSKEVTKNITHIKVEYGKNKTIKIGDSMADSYIAETSYKAYVFVNTGQENGKYKNSQDGKQETFDDSKVLGTSDKNGNFTAVKSKDRSKYLDELGNGANDDGEKNRWVSAMPDFIFTRMFYVIFKIFDAFVLAIPVILIQMLNVIAQTLVLMMILLFPIVLLMSFVPRMQDLIFGVLKVMFGGLLFPAITSLLTLLVFYIEKMIENIIITGFDGILKTLPSKARMVASDIGNKVESGITKTREVASQVPSRSLSTAQHLGNFALAGAGLGAGMLMNAKSHFQNVGSFFTNKESDNQFEEMTPSEAPDTLDASPSTTKPIIEKSKPVEEKAPTPSIESPITVEPTPSSDEEFQTLKEEWISPFKQLRMNSLERKLEEYKDPQAMYKAQGSNAFTRAYRKTMTRDDKLRSNIERRDRLTERLKQLRGE